MKSSLVLGSSLALIATIGAAPATAGAQDGMHVSVNVPDSVGHVVDRESASNARFTIVSRDGQATLLLMDTTIVAQMTDRGLDRMNAREATDTIKGVGNRVVARMVIGALIPLFDHGIAYHLRDLADAKYEKGRLQLIRRNGEEVFHGVEIGKGPLMEGFWPNDAKAFAARARAARARLDH